MIIDAFVSMEMILFGISVGVGAAILPVAPIYIILWVMAYPARFSET